MILGGFVGYLFGAWQRAIPGSHRSYLAKSLGKVAASMAILHACLWFVSMTFLYEVMREDAWFLISPVAILPSNVWILHKLLSDDEDDWFSDHWRRLKRWLREPRMSAQTGSLPAV